MVQKTHSEIGINFDITTKGYVLSIKLDEPVRKFCKELLKGSIESSSINWKVKSSTGPKDAKYYKGGFNINKMSQFNSNSLLDEYGASEIQKMKSNVAWLRSIDLLDDGEVEYVITALSIDDMQFLAGNLNNFLQDMIRTKNMNYRLKIVSE